MMSHAEFKPGVYRHYKGRHYLALGLARADESGATVVVYTRLYPRAGLPMSTRLLKIWNESVTTADGVTHARFTYIGHETPVADVREIDSDSSK